MKEHELGGRGDPIWFGDPNAPLFGWLHKPEHDRAQGGVVLFPPIGRELLPSYAPMRRLATRLAARGLLAIRFDYPGTGNSAGHLADEDVVARWVAAAGEARSILDGAGVGWTAFVGLRIGALLAVASAGVRPVDALVAWAPYRSGADFLREQHSLQLIKFGERVTTDGGSMQLPGFVLEPIAADSISGLRADRNFSQAARRQMVVLPSASPVRRHWERLAQETEHADLVEINDIDDMLVTGEMSEESETAIIDWVAADRMGVERPLRELRLPNVATVASGPEDPIVEHARFFGPTGLFGIATVPAVATPSATLVFLSTGRDHTIGPAREWVTLSRRLAEDGYHSVRFDLSGLGDSPVRSGQNPHEVYSPEAITDVDEVLTALRAEGHCRFVLIGLCSGAYTAIEAALHLDVEGVVAVNPILDFSATVVTSDLLAGESTRLAVTSRRWLVSTLGRSRLVQAVSRSLPSSAWRLIHTLRLQRYPAAAFGRLTDRGVRTLIACGVEEARPFQIRSAPLLRRLKKQSNFNFLVIDGLDHVLLDREPRLHFEQLIASYIRESYPVRVVAASVPRSTQ